MNDSELIPEPPFALRDRGLKFWRAMYGELCGDNKLQPADVYILARYCTALAEWEDLDEYSRTHEVFEKMISSKGVEYFAKHPKISRLEAIEPLLLRYEKQLGIGAGSRNAKRKPPGEDDEGDLKNLFGR